jgi:hypothetical protein
VRSWLLRHGIVVTWRFNRKIMNLMIYAEPHRWFFSIGFWKGEHSGFQEERGDP